MVDTRIAIIESLEEKMDGKKMALRMKVDCLFDREKLDIEKFEGMRNGERKLLSLFVEM